MLAILATTTKAYFDTEVEDEELDKELDKELDQFDFFSEPEEEENYPFSEYNDYNQDEEYDDFYVDPNENLLHRTMFIMS